MPPKLSKMAAAAKAKAAAAAAAAKAKAKAKAKAVAAKAAEEAAAVRKRPAGHEWEDEDEEEDEEAEEEEAEEEEAEEPPAPSPARSGRGRGSPAKSPAERRTPRSARGAPAAAESPSNSKRLRVGYEEDEEAEGGATKLLAGLSRLRRSSHLCDASVVSGAGRVPVHHVVLAAHSDRLAARIEGEGKELNLQTASYEAADLLVRWLYGEVDASSYKPSGKVNEELLQLSSELCLPGLAELCAARLAKDVDTENVVARVRLCEAFGLPRLRAALVSALVEDGRALHSVASDVATLGHPALMRELLAAIAEHKAVSETGEPPSKRQR